jgi:hypothetical protein
MEMKKNNSKKNIKDFPEQAMAFCVRRRQWFLVLVALILLGFGGYFWYIFLVKPQWSSAEKQAYISTKENAAAFNQGKFDAALNEIQNRKNEYAKDAQNAPDIFGLQ